MADALVDNILEILTLIARVLLILFLCISQYLLLLISESFGIKPEYQKIIRLVLCLILPISLIFIGGLLFVSGFEINILDLPFFWYYVIVGMWLGIGLITYSEVMN